MQEKSDNLEIFLDRFGQIKSKHGDSLVKTCIATGITRSLFYEIRDGNRTVSDKVWAKLERAEIAAGISTDTPANAESSANPNDSGIGIPAYAEREESGTTLRDEPMFYPPKKPPDDLLSLLRRIANAQESIAESEIANVESQRRMAAALEKLVEIGKNMIL